MEILRLLRDPIRIGNFIVLVFVAGALVASWKGRPFEEVQGFVLSAMALWLGVVTADRIL